MLASTETTNVKDKCTIVAAITIISHQQEYIRIPVSFPAQDGGYGQRTLRIAMLIAHVDWSKRYQVNDDGVTLEM